jgi:hypothetical protein
MVDVNIGTNHIQLNGMKRDNCVGKVLDTKKSAISRA